MSVAQTCLMSYKNTYIFTEKVTVPCLFYYRIVIIGYGFCVSEKLWKTIVIHNYQQLYKESLWTTVDNSPKSAKKSMVYRKSNCGQIRG